MCLRREQCRRCDDSGAAHVSPTVQSRSHPQFVHLLYISLPMHVFIHSFCSDQENSALASYLFIYPSSQPLLL